MDKLSYALGLSIGYNFRGAGVKELNCDDFAAALKAVYEDSEKSMTLEEAKEIVNDYFAKVDQENSELAEKAGKEYLAENAKREGVKMTATGLQYQVIEEGTGAMPTATDSVTVHYTGALIDGKVFDSSVERGAPATFGVNQVIPGWTEALQMMKEGAKWRLFIPSSLGYGPQGAGPIPPNSTLVFDVHLIKVEK